MALECNGVIKYARGARSCAQQEYRNISERTVRNDSLMMPLRLFAILDKSLPLTPLSFLRVGETRTLQQVAGSLETVTSNRTSRQFSYWDIYRAGPPASLGLSFFPLRAERNKHVPLRSSVC